MKTLFTTHSHSTGGRAGHVETTDGVLKFDLSMPGAPNAKPGSTNPEALFACGYAACFGGALDFIAKKQGLDASGATVGADVSLNQDDNGFFLSVVMNVMLPNLSGATAEKLVHDTHGFCPYSKATRGNIDVALVVNGSPLAKAA